MTRWSWLTGLTSLGGAAAITGCALLAASCTSRNVLGYSDAGSDTSSSPVDAFDFDGYSKTDAPPIVVDASVNPDGITQVGPSYVCGPVDAGVRCSCGLEPYFPAPVNANGQQQTYVLTPDPATVVNYATLAEFDAVAVGRWQRTAGVGELVCEQFGVDFTADHRIVPLVLASNGTVQEVTAQARSFTLVFGTHPMLSVDNGGLLTNPPVFFDGGQSMYLVFSPWAADYARVAGP